MHVYIQYHAYFVQHAEYEPGIIIADFLSVVNLWQSQRSLLNQQRVCGFHYMQLYSYS